MGKSKLRIGELASQAGVAPSALRYYEAAGLLDPFARTDAGYRVYNTEALGRIQFIQRAKALGLRLTEIRRLIKGPHVDSEAERQAIRHVVAHKIAETRARVGELQELDSELQRLYTYSLRSSALGCGHLGDCGCWLPTEQEVKMMADEIACCSQNCCPECSCTEGTSCDCENCPCSR